MIHQRFNTKKSKHARQLHGAEGTGTSLIEDEECVLASESARPVVKQALGIQCVGHTLMQPHSLGGDSSLSEGDSDMPLLASASKPPIIQQKFSREETNQIYESTGSWNDGNSTSEDDDAMPPLASGLLSRVMKQKLGREANSSTCQDDSAQLGFEATYLARQQGGCSGERFSPIASLEAVQPQCTCDEVSPDTCLEHLLQDLDAGALAHSLNATAGDAKPASKMFARRCEVEEEEG